MTVALKREKTCFLSGCCLSIRVQGRWGSCTTSRNQVPAMLLLCQEVKSWYQGHIRASKKCGKEPGPGHVAPLSFKEGWGTSPFQPCASLDLRGSEESGCGAQVQHGESELSGTSSLRQEAQVDFLADFSREAGVSTKAPGTRFTFSSQQVVDSFWDHSSRRVLIQCLQGVWPVPRPRSSHQFPSRR